MALDLLKVLDSIHPSDLDYSDWTKVGMALKAEGYSSDVWDRWSANGDPRYRPGDCEKKWETFHGEAVAGGTLVQIAKDNGAVFKTERDEGHGLDWDSPIEAEWDDALTVVREGWVETGEAIIEPKNEDWKPVDEIITYLKTLFNENDYVGYVVTTWEKEDGTFAPSKGNYGRTAGELIHLLKGCKGDIGAVLGDWKEEAGAWVRFNPLDGKDVKNENVVDFRHALVESDVLDIETQLAIMKEIELPISTLVYSGGKSIHATVKIDANNLEEYKKRVDYLYTVCDKNGLRVDKQNKNPSRLSRLPGVTRKGKKQFLLDTNIGQPSWEAWEEWIEGVNDDLPDPESLSDFWDEMPQLAPSLIDGILRQGHKMLLAGPSKAGKSFALIELCIAIASGSEWLGWSCTKGKVLYVNLELDRPSALHRFKDVIEEIGQNYKCIKNIDLWNLRGKSVPMDKLAPKLIRRAQKKGYIAVVIDPIYKVITGDENSAGDMAKFANQFDKIATELGCAVIYCHHHSKGSQAGKKSMDRASGSGVFARDPDALLDMTELEIGSEKLKEIQEQDASSIYYKWIEMIDPHYALQIPEKEVKVYSIMKRHANNAILKLDALKECELEIEKNSERLRTSTAWRIDGTLREYPKFDPLDIWFGYPLHTIDSKGQLKDLEPEGADAPWVRGGKKTKERAEKTKEKKQDSFEITYSTLAFDNAEVTIKDMAEAMGVTERTIRNRIKNSDSLELQETGPSKPSIIVWKCED